MLKLVMTLQHLEALRAPDCETAEKQSITVMSTEIAAGTEAMDISDDAAASSCNFVVGTADGLVILAWPRTPACTLGIAFLSALPPENSARKPTRNRQSSVLMVP